jgi:hypothetical protein
MISILQPLVKGGLHFFSLEGIAFAKVRVLLASVFRYQLVRPLLLAHSQGKPFLDW